MNNIIDRLESYITAAYPAVAIETHEEKRAYEDICVAAERCKKNVAAWSATEGAMLLRPTVVKLQDTDDLGAALRSTEIIGNGSRLKDTVYVMRDVNAWVDIMNREPAMARALRDLLTWGPTEGMCVVFLGASAKLHPTIEKLVTVVDYDLPSAETLGKIADGIAGSWKIKAKADEGVIRALSGLTTTEAENALSLSAFETKGFTPEVLYREKVQSVKRGGVLEILEADPRGLDAIGGWDIAKAWVRERAEIFRRASEARDFGIPGSKGVLVCGVPGGGKSLFATCVGAELGIPTLACDMGRLYNSLVGESQRLTREMWDTAEALAPVVLRIDEIEKGFAGTANGGDNTGVSMQVLSTFLTRLQDSKAPIFLVGTANDAWLLPAPLIRKGRFDEIFIVDLPTAAERQAIFEIHIQKKKREPRKFKLGELVQESEGFVGAEIEAVVNTGLLKAFVARRELTSNDLLGAVRSTVPLSKTSRDQVDRIREWGKGKAVFVSTPDDAPGFGQARGRKIA